MPPHTLFVIALEDEGAAAEWNFRCRDTFPDDIVMVGDMITRVNEESRLDCMMGELADAPELFLTLSRNCSGPGPISPMMEHVQREERRRAEERWERLRAAWSQGAPGAAASQGAPGSASIPGVPFAACVPRTPPQDDPFRYIVAEVVWADWGLGSVASDSDLDVEWADPVERLCNDPIPWGTAQRSG